MTFATSTIKNSNATIVNIEKQIAELQERLTQLQEQQQAIKSAEQQGLSAIAQFKAAIAAIAQLDEREMLKQFLEEMTTTAITANAVGNVQPQLTEEPEPHTPEVEPEPNIEPQAMNPEPTPEVEVQEVQAEVIPDDVVDTINQLTSPPDDYTGITFAQLKTYAKSVGLTTTRLKKSDLERLLWDGGYSPQRVREWLATH